MNAARLAILAIVSLFLLAACAQPIPDEIDLAARIEEAVEGTVEALASVPPDTATPAPTQPPTSTSTLAPTHTPTPTPPPPMVRVSLATNCRTGPGLAYPIARSFEPGQVAQVTARSTVQDYWYITLPDQGNERCWLWGEYATLDGDTSALPVLTPPASPVPQIDFTLYRHSFSDCGSTRLALIVVNAGTTVFRTARIHVEDLSTSDDLHGPRLDPHPFADNPSSCPKDEGSDFLPPGATAYLVIPLSPFEGGHDAVANIRLCSGEDGTGDCVTKSAYFRLPVE